MSLSNRLPDLASAIADLHRSVTAHSIAAAEAALAAGAALVEVKALVPHGAWGDFLQTTGLSDRTAQRYMVLHRGGLNSAMVAELGIAQSERISSLGLRLWPKDGTGHEVAGELAETGHHRGYAITLPEPEGRARYHAVHLFSDPSNDFWVTRVCGVPAALGLLHDGFDRVFGHSTHHRMSLSETKAAYAEIHTEFVGGMSGPEVQS